MTALLVAAGGALGALLRYLLERAAVRRFRERMPWGTLAANLLGAAVLAFVFALEQRGLVAHEVLVFVGTGVCGALTTFSGFMGQVESRWRHRATRRLAAGYLLTSLALGLLLLSLVLAVALPR